MARGKLFVKYEQQVVKNYNKQIFDMIGDCAVWKQWRYSENSEIKKHSSKLYSVRVGGQIIYVCLKCKRDLGRTVAYLDAVSKFNTPKKWHRIVYGGCKS